MVKIPPWSRDETILALHTYINHGRVRENSTEAQKLSQYLRHLTDPKTTPNAVPFHHEVDCIDAMEENVVAADPNTTLQAKQYK